MWVEGSLGLVDNMLPPFSPELENIIPGVVTPNNNTALFQQWWEEFGYFNGVPVMQESIVIKNYGR
jgi:hypothetical protein